VNALLIDSNDDNEVTICNCRYGHHLGATFDGWLHEKEYNLPLNITAQISKDRKSWYGAATIPTEYLPQRVSL